MSRRLAWMACCLPILAIASPALAFSFAPPGAAFTGTGKMNFAGSGFDLHCTAVFTGATDTVGGARIDGVGFSGGLLGACRGVHPLGLPWGVKATGRHEIVISIVHVDAPLVGDCEGRDVPAAIDERGVIRFGLIALPPKCRVTGGLLTTRPLVNIVGS